MTNQLIEQLVNDLKPRKPLLNLKLWLYCGMCFISIAALVLIVLGLRSHYQVALDTGAMFWKPGMFLAAWVGGMFFVTNLSRPIQQFKKWHLVPFFLAGGILFWQLTTYLTNTLGAQIISDLNDPTIPYCIFTIFTGGSLSLIVTWFLWLRKSASLKPSRLGALAGFSCGCLTASAYAICCDNDTSLYIIIYYGSPILILTFIGALLGRNLLKW